MTSTKTLSELEILQLAHSELTRRVNTYLARIKKYESETVCEIIANYDSQLLELEERMEALEKKEETRA